MDRFAHVIGPVVGTYYTEEVVKPKIHKKETDKSKLIEADGKLSKLLPVVETQLTANRFLAGDSLTIGDVVAHGYMSSVEATTLSLNDFPKIQAWVAGLTAMPEWQAMSKRYPSSF